MRIMVTVYQCDLEDTKNKEIMDIFQAELRTMGKFRVDNAMADHHELDFYPNFKMREAHKVLKMARIAQQGFAKNDEYVVVYARVNF